MERQKFMAEFFLKKRNELDPADFDAFVLEDLNKATTRAKRLLGVDDLFVNAHNPVIVAIPVATTETMEPIFVYNKDKLRYDLANFSALFFGEKFLFHYSCLIDHKTGASLNDKTLEIPYSKIKTIETSSRFAFIDKMEHHIFEIKILFNDLETIVIPLRILLVDIKTPKEDYLIPQELLDLSASLKAFLRTKIHE